MVLAVPIALVFVAVALLIFYYAAAPTLQRAFSEVLSRIPFIGPYVLDAVTSAFNVLFGQWLAAIKVGTNALALTISVPTNVTRWVLSWVATFSESVAATARFVFVKVNALALQVANTTFGIVSELVNLARQIAAVADSIGPIALHYATIMANAVEYRLNAALHALDLALTAAINTVRLDFGQAIDGVLHNLDQVRLGLLHAIDTAIAGVHTWVDQRLQPIEQEVGQIQGVVDALPAVASIVGTIEAVQVIEKLVEDCVKPTCSGIGPSLDILNALADGTMLAAMLALVAQGRSDPEGTAKEIIGVTDGAVSVMRGILAPAGI